MKKSALLAVLSLFSLCLSLSAQTDSFSKSNFLSRVTLDVARSKISRVEGGDFDDKRDRIAFKLKFRNNDPNKSFDGLKYELFVFGQSMVDRKAYRLLQRTKGDFSLAPLQTFENETPEIVTEWDDTGAIFGEKYKGWYLFIYGPDGALVTEKSVSPIFSMGASLDGLSEGKYYDKSLKPLKTPGQR